jgi:tetratricopeptide (TPR) repeat protein
VHASNAARFEAAYKNIADRLQLPGCGDTTVNVLQLVCNWLCSEGSGRWLIILDNADDRSLFRVQRQDAQSASSGDTRSRLTLADFLPQGQNGSILITSRNRDIAIKLTGRDKDVIRIQSMNRDQGLELLQNKLLHPLTGPATELLAALDYMPFAIARAAAYINKRWPRTTIASYTQDLQTGDKEREKLLSQAAIDLDRDREASNSILATLQISFEHIREDRPSAADLLSFMSLFNPQGIPEFLLRHYSDCGGEFEDDLDLLRSYSLVTTNEVGDVFEMHRLVQFAIRAWLRSFGGEDRWRRKFLATLSQEFPTGEFKNWSQCRLLLPHVESLVSDEPVNTEEAKWWAQILYNAAWYTRSQGLYIRAEEIVRCSIRARTKTLGIQSTDTLSSVNELALVLQEQGKYSEAEQMHRRTLEGREKELGKEHPETLTSFSDLAWVLQHQGKYSEAEQMSRRVLEGYEKALGKEHPHTLTSFSDLAWVLQHQGKYSEAEQMSRRALEGRRKELGKEHPGMLIIVYNLAYLYHQQKRYDAASELYQKAYDGLERTLGPSHPTTVACCYNFAKMVREMDNAKR